MATQHSRQPSFASSFVSTSATSYNTSAVKPKKRTPVKIGPWKLGKTLGKGATGRVFLATNVENNTKAAVKIVSKASLNNTDQLKDSDEQDCDSAGLSYGIEREIIIMKLLNHDNVLRLYDVWETERALYLVLEYVEGGELFDLLVDSGPLPEKTAVEFFRQIILGAAYCHSLGICHRDLKPENILLDKDLKVKIADFGMAALESGRLLETSCGSPHYAAPEIVSGLHYHGAESDVWSCGVILFALLTGRLPFDDDNIRDLLLKVQVGKFEIVEDLSIEAIDLIHKMLTVDPAARIKTRDILKHPFIKKYYDCEKDAAFTQLPSPECAMSPVKSKQAIDQRILENLVILWHGRSSDSIVQALLSPEPNSEKTFYALLLRYRHDHALSNGLNNNGNNNNNNNNNSTFNNHNNNNNNNNTDLIRSSSVISKAHEPLPTSSSSSSSSSGSKRRSFVMTASTPNRRPISFQKGKHPRSRDSLHSISPSGNNITPPRSSAYYQQYPSQQQQQQQQQPSTQQQQTSRQTKENVISKNQTKESTTEIFNNNNDNKRSSLILTESTPTKRRSRLPSEHSNLKKMLSIRVNSNSKLKRNSVTSKVLSSYAKMAELEKKQNSDDYAKRLSSDFAALCDVLFNDETKSNMKAFNSDSVSTLNKLVLGDKRRSSRISTGPTSPLPATNKRNSKSEKRKSTASKRSSIINNKNSNRTSSNPIERISRLLNHSDVEQFERRTASDFHATGISTLAEPPKPISRLDPRYRAYETYQKRTSQHAAELLRLQEEAEAEAKALEEIRLREEKLRKEQEELELLKKRSMRGRGSEFVDQPFDDVLGISSGTVRTNRNSKTADDTVDFKPSKVKNSKLKSNRYSALSMYSTKASSKRLSFYLRELDDEMTKTVEQNKKDRLSRLSMLVSEPDLLENDDYEDDDAVNAKQEFDIDLNFNNSSMKTLTEGDEDTANTSVSELGIKGRTRNASVSDVLDEDLIFVNNSAPKSSNIQQQKHEEKLVENSDFTNGSSVYQQIPPLQHPNVQNESIPSAPENINQKGPKLPNIPGSPIKESTHHTKKSNGTFEIFEDAIRKSKQEFEDLESKLVSAPQKIHNTAKVHEKSHPKSEPRSGKVVESSNVSKPILKEDKIQVPKQRQPLAKKDENSQNQQHNSGRRTSAFLSKLIQPSSERKVSPPTERKSSFGQTIKSLFHGSSLAESKSLYTLIPAEDSFDAMKTLLVGWKHYGVGNLMIDNSHFTLRGDIAKNNHMNVKYCKFSCVITKTSDDESKMTFNHEKGSSKSFERLVDEVKRILSNEKVLAP